MVAELQSARDALSRQGEATGRLRIAASVSFGNSHLAPVMADLALRHPRLEISTCYSDRLVDLVGEGFDAAVRLGNLTDSSLIARRISPIRAVLVASPAYLERRGMPRTPADLAGHDTIPHGDQMWQFRHEGRLLTHRPRGRFAADSGSAELAAVVAGLGIAMMPTFLARPAVDRGEIVTLLDGYAIPEAGLYIVRPPPADPMPKKIKALTDIIVEKFGAGSNWDGHSRAA
jgi:DNA-binding transcriptional LysR family regulator